MNKLKGKTAIVTGASKGIGAEIAKYFAQNGAQVVVHYLSDEASAKVIVNNIKNNKGKAIICKADLTKSSDIAYLFTETEKHFGTIDILVNNAGVYHFEPFEMITETEYHRQMNANVFNVLFTSQKALHYFNKNGGSILNISSIATVKATPTAVLYTATKGAVDAITTTLAKELASKNIRVNAILPGPTPTEGNPIGGTDMESFIVANTPLGRLGNVTDIAETALFLAADSAGFITGQKIGVSGGFD